MERDAHDNIRIAEINFGELLKAKVQERLREFGLKATVVAKNIGYELRCADPIPYDMEYTRDLGFSAAQFILDGGSGAMVSIQNARFVPLYFKDILDPVTLKTKIRMVDPASESFYIARRYMLRLNQADFDDPHELAKLAATAGMSIEKFKNTFGYLIDSDLLYQFIKEGKFAIESSESNIAHRLNAENNKTDELDD